jgi:hypothetical protein
MSAETLCMNDLYVALPKTSIGKSKKNPSIHINGEKVFDSDVEEKKEKSRPPLLLQPHKTLSQHTQAFPPQLLLGCIASLDGYSPSLCICEHAGHLA